MQKFLPLLETVPLLAGLEAEQLADLPRALDARVQAFARGEIVLHVGDAIRALGVVLSGRLEISQEDYHGNAVLLAGLSAGELFAESFACTERHSTVQVRAAENAQVLWLSFACLRAPSPTDALLCARVSANLTEMLARKNIFLTGRIAHISKRTLCEKVLSYLYEVSAQAGSRSFTIPFDRRQLAEYLAADRSALSAVLGRLRDEGVLTFHKNHFTLHSPHEP